MLRAWPVDRSRAQRSAGESGDYGIRRTFRHPRGPRAGWIDTPLDGGFWSNCGGDQRSIVSSVRVRFRHARSGTGEIGSWIVIAGACSKARAVDYIPAHHAVTGQGSRTLVGNIAELGTLQVAEKVYVSTSSAWTEILDCSTLSVRSYGPNVALRVSKGERKLNG